ncbi:plexin-A1 isoform X4 [Octopus sinensis]|uniref:Plexin-A1 isoform X4 n=1 Tax=Octopus sinensis TaxID=2607531 RepID=A0A7E6ETL0_9MOLL|nr:plexin-A1 isoform X4 [Octopus sinensis]
MKGVVYASLRMWRNVAFLVLVMPLLYVSGDYIVSSFQSSKNGSTMNHYVVNKNTGKIYVGAVNRLYQLSPDLKEEINVSTGPIKSSPQCPPQKYSCESGQFTDTYNKVLVVNYASQELIACSTQFHGICEKRYLANMSISNTNKPLSNPVVANSLNATTFAFIAPGPSQGNGVQPNVLYVGATRTNIGLRIYRDLVPAFCIRNLDNFEIAYKSPVEQSSKKEIETQHRETFKVNYIYGFSSEKFSYMLTVQKANTQDERYASKIFRVCQNDKNFYSYAELSFKCGSNRVYNLVQAAYLAKAGSTLAQNLGIPTTEDVLYAVFSHGQTNKLEPQPRSALCIYPMRIVRKIFTQNIRQCFKGLGNIGPEHLTKSTLCQKTKLQIDDNYCGTLDINTPIAGTVPVEVPFTQDFPSIIASAVAVSITYDYTVAFIGTTVGTVIKVSIESSHSAMPYETIHVAPDQRIFPDLYFDLDKEHLYAMTPNKLSKVRVEDCSRYTSCSDCIGVKDPYCGWCTLENKCSLRAECKEADQDLRWLPYTGQNCSAITSHSPSQVQIRKLAQKTVKITLQVMNLPQVRGQYECAFSAYGRNHTLTTNAQKARDQVICRTPISSKLPPIPTGKDHIVMKLSVRVGGKDFVSVNFTFFDCNVHSSCMHCIQSKFPCNWCIKEHLCTTNKTKNSSDIVLGNAYTGSKLCPRIEYDSAVIPVASGTEKSVSLKAMNLKDFQTDIKCKFKLNQDVKVHATKTSTDRIICDPVSFSYEPDVPYRNVPFEITWGPNERPLDNLGSIQVKMYKCESMATSCGICLTMDKIYRCGWCENKCSIRSQCTNYHWFPSSEICRNVKITEFHPSKGPKEGGTLLTIRGENLGKTFSDIKKGVTVVGAHCEPIESEYVPAQKIVCRTGRSSKKSGAVRVVVATFASAMSDFFYQYVVPEINGLEPTMGPKDGGTRVTVKGDHLDAGYEKSITIAGLPCRIERVERRELVCVTQYADRLMRGMVNMTIDQTVINSNNVDYSYVVNPKVSDIVPKKSVCGGGIPMNVYGQNFSIIQQPQMIVWVRNKEYRGQDCSQMRDSHLICYFPNITEPVTSGNINLPQRFSYGFHMDNVTNLLNLTDYLGTVEVQDNPIFSKFTEKVKSHLYTNEYLTINGQNLNKAVDEAHVSVRIGMGRCNVTSIASSQLTCQPPKVQPEAMSDSDYPEVIVRVGRNLTYHIGFLRYEEPEGTSLHMVIGLAVGGAVLLLIVIIVVIAYRVKSKQSNTMKKQLHEQMDQLELKVAQECKEAFAELQTDMTELNNDMSGQVSIPFWDYRTYCMKVLFPGDKDHPVTKYQPNSSNLNSKPLQLFMQLIKNATFLLTFIRTLEAHQSFTMRDRVKVASLISVTLQSDMVYATSILKTLLEDLIKRSIEGNNHPKLLLRRTESVAEKMLSNWFTFLLYRFLQDCAGKPLFLLFQAIKHQVSKGPVDAISSEAKYSLSEDKLIRQQIDFRTLTINVCDTEQFSQPYVPVKVLDCDTITHVKEKIMDAIYKNAPFSRRPPIESLDLEWRSTPNEILILNDEDSTSKIEGDLKRLNSLAHYKVNDGAYMALRKKQTPVNTGPPLQEKPTFYKYERLISENSLYTRSPSLGRTVNSSGIPNDGENNIRKYHLVKQHDSPTHREGDRGSKMVSEIYLTRLLTTKGTLQQYVDDLFERIFSTTHRGQVLPLAIKYIFDFLDEQAQLHNIEPEVVHTWKSNSLPLRFWVNIIKNPNFVFDIHKSHIVDSCLSVTAQTFMDSCSMSEHRLGKDSPSSKLLYAKDIPKYKAWVDRYYEDIKSIIPISDQDMNSMLQEESRLHCHEFNTEAALNELYKYVDSYSCKLLQALESDETASRSKLDLKLQQVMNLINNADQSY